MDVARLRDVEVVRDGSLVVGGVDLTVRAGERWALLGPNGAGKSTVLNLLGAWRFPTLGSVSILGTTLGRGDLREVRARIGWVDPAFPADPLSTVRDVVLTGATGTSDLLWRAIPPAERDRAEDLIRELRVDHLAGRAWNTLSTGERGRTLVARALMPSPELLLLDEPFTGLDLPGREDLRAGMDALVAADPTLASVLVTHHLEELPGTTTHAALLRAGRLVAGGPVSDVLRTGPLSECFARPVEVTRSPGGWSATAARRAG